MQQQNMAGNPGFGPLIKYIDKKVSGGTIPYDSTRHTSERERLF
jgi:hypothetical protein